MRSLLIAFSLLLLLTGCGTPYTKSQEQGASRHRASSPTSSTQLKCGVTISGQPGCGMVNNNGYGINIMPGKGYGQPMVAP
jgi:hypothetical protein